MRDYIPLIVFFILIAGLVRAEKALIILYLLAILILVNRWLSRNAIHSVSFERNLTQRAFLEQPVSVDIKISNRSRLPLVWMQLHESLPVEMVVPGHFSQVITLGGRGTAILKYTLRPHKRGLYPIGPASLSSSDLLGVGRETRKEYPASTLIVYPRIVSLESLGLPSHSMFGTIFEKNPIFEDPSRPFGKRGYQTGDSLRKVDWKTTAALGSMQVKLFQATKALELAICLDLNPASYDFMHHYDQTELAIVAAASISNWAVRRHHAVALITNGSDPVSQASLPSLLPLKKGSAQLMVILETLARIQSSAGEEFHLLVNRTSAALPWGATVLLITGQMTEMLMDEMLRMRRCGLNPAVINIGNYPGLLDLQRRARRFGIKTFQLQTALDLEHGGK